ncbi:hypothetical protein N656DRAFT_598157 [Canariomyces notabilis]|uniref:Uncharacterized protein n=1 Tax=Canariomyces notabilis TaxID=2074819 RepID=A0AAN6TG55_9PEZI|nr:hypothetical protein N656DRAFT_598157 [Canariomyces arenarius]
MAFIQDPRLRQRWNQISHNTEAITSDAAAGIWTFGHRYVNPCLAGLADAVDSCTSVCLGDREERARRARERDRGARRTRAEYSFDFYDDWDDDDFDYGYGYGYGYGGDYGGVGGSSSSGGGGDGGGGSRRLDWDRLLAGTGSGRRGHHHESGAGDVIDQPRRKRGMSYGTRGVRRKASGAAASEEDDPNVIPRTAPLGFLGRLPFKIVGSLRYKPSAANLKDHPGGGAGLLQGSRGDGAGEDEHEPLLRASEDEDHRRRGAGDSGRRTSPARRSRPRSDTTESGDTSSSYRSRGDLFPSDGEGEEDAVPLDDEFTVALERVDDRSSNRTRSSKGKRPADKDRDKGLSRTVSRTTLSSSTYTLDEAKGGNALSRSAEDTAPVPSLEDLQREEEQAQREEDEEIERKRQAASQLAQQRGLSKDQLADASEEIQETKDDSLDREGHAPPVEDPAPDAASATADGNDPEVKETKPAPAILESLGPQTKNNMEGRPNESRFVPARLPYFG